MEPEEASREAGRSAYGKGDRDIGQVQQVPRHFSKDLDPVSLALFLEENGIPSSACTAFEG